MTTPKRAKKAVVTSNTGKPRAARTRTSIAKATPKSASKSLSRAVASFEGLVSELREFITETRRQIVRAVDVIQVRTCWGVGRHIVEFEQQGAARAEYGAKLLPKLAGVLTAEFGKGFDERNLRHMRQFYEAFPIWDAVRSELSWTHYRILSRVEDPHAREWYVNEVIAQNWSSRALERQIGRLYYERLLASKDRAAVREEAERAASNSSLPNINWCCRLKKNCELNSSANNACSKNAVSVSLRLRRRALLPRNAHARRNSSAFSRSGLPASCESSVRQRTRCQ